MTGKLPASSRKTPPCTQSPDNKKPYIVSSSHLASPGYEDVSAFEFALTVMNNAFQRWMTRASAVAGLPELSALDILVLHSINHRDREKSIADLMFTLNLSERHYLNYAMKKLDDLGLITRHRRGKEVYLKATLKGREYCTDYARVRSACLLDLLPEDMEHGGVALGEVARAMRVLTGFYEQAARSAASL